MNIHNNLDILMVLYTIPRMSLEAIFSAQGGSEGEEAGGMGFAGLLEAGEQRRGAEHLDGEVESTVAVGATTAEQAVSVSAAGDAFLADLLAHL